MMATTAKRLVTAEELELFPDDGYQYELVEGVVQRMAPASFEPSNIAARVLARIVNHVEEHDQGEVTGADGGYVLARPPETVRIGEVYRVMEGPVAPMDCVSEDPADQTCPLIDG